MKEVIRNNRPGIVSGIIAGVFVTLLSYGLNLNSVSKNDLKNELKSKASIEYVNQSISNQKEVQNVGNSAHEERIKNIENQVNKIYDILIKGK